MTLRSGSVRTFDAERGRGVVVADDGVEFGFHATAVADGSRSIAPGADVVFRRVPGHGGTWEAASIRAV